MPLTKASSYLIKPVSNAPLVVFRIAFGGLLLYSTIRTAQKGWIKELFIEPTYHFGFFTWINPLEGNGMYVIFFLMGISALGIILGFLYRINTVLFFLLFTYTELLDKTYYLNHYYLVSILTFWLILVPAHHWYAIDTILFPKIRSQYCRQWHIWIFKVQLSIVYFFAGLAKVNPDWLFRAQPMATWLPGKYGLPILGSWVHLKGTAFLFSWAGCIYDLFIWIFLWAKRTRGIAYLFVWIFHILTAILFPRIGMFPFIMITSTIIFFSPSWHQKILSYLPFFNRMQMVEYEDRSAGYRNRFVLVLIGFYLIVQLYLPFRYLQYSGNLFWHEKGYRFSWRVMLMEKSGYTSIIVKDPNTNIQREVDQDDYLTPFQKQQMRSQPDMILQFARFIGDQFYKEHGHKPEVYIKSRLSLNGRRSQPFTDDKLDVYNIADPMSEGWVLPLKER